MSQAPKIYINSDSDEMIIKLLESIYEELGFIGIGLTCDIYVRSEPYSSVTYNSDNNTILCHLRGLMEMPFDQMVKVVIIRMYQLYQIVSCNKPYCIDERKMPAHQVLESWTKEFEKMLAHQELSTNSNLIQDAVNFWKSYEARLLSKITGDLLFQAA